MEKEVETSGNTSPKVKGVSNVQDTRLVDITTQVEYETLANTLAEM